MTLTRPDPDRSLSNPPRIPLILDPGLTLPDLAVADPNLAQGGGADPLDQNADVSSLITHPIQTPRVAPPLIPPAAFYHPLPLLLKQSTPTLLGNLPNPNPSSGPSAQILFLGITTCTLTQTKKTKKNFLLHPPMRLCLNRGLREPY